MSRVASEQTVWTAEKLADCKHSRARVPPAPPICSASAMSTVSDNDDAPQPNHALVASLLPTIRPPKALETPDGHTKRSTAQLVIGKTLSLCLMAGILGGIYAFGELTSGVGAGGFPSLLVGPIRVVLTAARRPAMRSPFGSHHCLYAHALTDASRT